MIPKEPERPKEEAKRREETGTTPSTKPAVEEEKRAEAKPAQPAELEVPVPSKADPPPQKQPDEEKKAPALAREKEIQPEGKAPELKTPSPKEQTPKRAEKPMSEGEYNEKFESEAGDDAKKESARVMVEEKQPETEKPKEEKKEEAGMFSNVGWKRAEEQPQSSASPESANKSEEAEGAAGENEEDQAEMEDVQRVINDYTARMKKVLDKSDTRMADLIAEKIVIGESDGAEYQLVPMPDLMEIVKSLGGFSETELKDIEDIFAQLGTPEYVFVESLLEFFGEQQPDEGENNGAAMAESEPEPEAEAEPEEAEKMKEYRGKYDEQSAEQSQEEKPRTIGNLTGTALYNIGALSYFIRHHVVTVEELFADVISRQPQQPEIETVQAGDFFEIIRQVGACFGDDVDDKSIIHYLRISKSNPDVLSFERIKQLLADPAVQTQPRPNYENGAFDTYNHDKMKQYKERPVDEAVVDSEAEREPPTKTGVLDSQAERIYDSEEPQKPQEGEPAQNADVVVDSEVEAEPDEEKKKEEVPTPIRKERQNDVKKRAVSGTYNYDEEFAVDSAKDVSSDHDEKRKEEPRIQPAEEVLHRDEEDYGNEDEDQDEESAARSHESESQNNGGQESDPQQVDEEQKEGKPRITIIFSVEKNEEPGLDAEVAEAIVPDADDIDGKEVDI